MPLWDGKFYDRPSTLGTHWIKSLMTCYLAAKKRWITRSKQMLPPHTGPSENNVILEDQLKCRQTDTNKPQTNTHWSPYIAQTCPLLVGYTHTNTHRYTSFISSCSPHPHTYSCRHSVGFCWNTHTMSELYLFVFYSLSCYRREDITQHRVVDKISFVCPIVLILVWKVRSRHVPEGKGLPAEQTQPEQTRRMFRVPISLRISIWF